MDKIGLSRTFSRGYGPTSMASSTEDQELVSNESRISWTVHMHIWKGHDLVARDTSGSSDPYVKVKIKDKMLFKTHKIFQNLNPIWDERFDCIIEDLSSELQFQVFDYDRIGRDDYMGAAEVKLVDLEENRVNELKLKLQANGAEEYMGYILANITLKRITKEEECRLKLKKKSIKLEGSKVENRSMSLKFKKGRHSPEFLVNVLLAEGRNLVPPGTHRSNTSKILPSTYVKLKIGPTKFKSKVVSKTYDPKWLEQYELRSYCAHDEPMEVDVYDKRRDDLIGRVSVDLSKLPVNVTQQSWYELDNGSGEILLLITIRPVRSISYDEFSFQAKETEDIAAVANRFKMVKTFNNMRDVGFLVVKVHRAKGLASADIGSGKSDPFCIIELINDRVQTSTVYKSLEPEWNQYFTFVVRDINSVLEVTVYDEDQNSYPEFLGKLALPLLRIRDGQKRWYALKDKHLQKRAKGLILLEMKMMWNPVRAAVCSFSPKEHKYLANITGFERQILATNLNRVKWYVARFGDGWGYVQSCFNWESPPRSALAFITFLIITYYWRAYMLPLMLLIIFGFGYLSRKQGLNPIEQTCADEGCIVSAEEEKENDNVDETEENTSLAEKFRGIQMKLLELQNGLDFVASTFERVKNLFTFSQPFLSCVAVAALIVAMVVLYFIPVRYLIMIWGINKFTKRFRKSKKHTSSNNILNFLSRVFSDKEVRMYGEFHLSQRQMGS